MGAGMLAELFDGFAHERELLAMLDAVSAGVAVVDNDGVALVVNTTLAEMLETAAEQLVGVPITTLLCRTGGREVPFSEVSATESMWRRECSVAGARGHERRVDVTISRMTPPDDERLFVITAVDVTERQHEQARLTESALVDELTGLYNRRGFLTFARRHVATARRLRTPVGLLFMDLDGLKNVNDRLGHAEGDKMIKEAADVIRSTMRVSDILGRIGGDEFVACVLETSEDGVSGLISRLRTALESSAMEPRPYHLRMSCGVARSDPDGSHDIEHLLAEADTRMYAAKRAKAGAREDVLHVIYEGDANDEA